MLTRFYASFPALTLSLALIFHAAPAQAYIGPGAGLGAIAVTVALGLGVLLLLVGVVWYPVKRMLKKGRTNSDKTKKTPE